MSRPVSAPGRPSAAERACKFVDDAQITVFQSAPSPAGPDNADRSCSPLWRRVRVRWTKPAAARELTSEEAVLQAAEAQELSLELTNIVVNCPITGSVDGETVRGAR